MTAILNVLLEITIYSAILYVSILLFKKVFNKHISAALNYAVWALLVIRLLMPVTIDSGFSLFVIKGPQPEVAQNEYINKTNLMPQAIDNVAAIEQPVSLDISSEQIENANTDMMNEDSSKPMNLTIDWQTALVLLWAVGILGSVVYITAFWRRLNRKIKQSSTDVPLHIIDLVGKCKSDLGIKNEIEVSMHDWLNSPSLSVTLRPRLLLPASMLGMDRQQLEFGIRHELTHYKRKDHLMTLLLIFLRCVYWFNPIVWVSFPQIQSDMETMCDMSVTFYLKRAERVSYINTMVELSFRPNVKYVLGMGMCKGRKALEKRVKGVFMKKKTKPSVRLVAVFLTCVMLIVCFTTACQPTPEKPVVVNKGGDKLANEINATPAPEEKYQAPAQYKQEAQSFYDGMLSVSFDMQVETPDVSAYPVYTVQDADLTQQQVNRIVSVLMQDKPLKYYDDRDTKQEITEKFLLPAKKKLSEAKSGKEFSDDGGNISVEQLQDNVEMFEQWIANAPETKDEHSITAEEYTTSGSLSATADLGKSRPATLKIARTGQTFYYLQFINGTEYIYNGFSEPVDDLPLKTTKEQAVAIATQMVTDMGAEDFKLAAVGKTTRLGSEYDISSEEYQNTMAYSVVFTRTVDGIPLTYTPNDQIGIIDKDKMDAQIWRYERIMINIDDGGIANVFWNGNLQVGACVNDNVKLMKFEDIASRAMDQIKVQNAYLTDQDKEGEGIRQNKLEFYINKTKLGFARIRVKDSAEYRIVPVWDFFGSTTYYRDKNDIDAFNKEHGTDLKATEVYDNGYDAIVTINAIDGSVIDRNLGY